MVLRKTSLQVDLQYVRGQMFEFTKMAKELREADEELYHIAMTVPKMLVVLEEALVRRLKTLEYEKSLRPPAKKKIKPQYRSGG